MPKLPFIYKDHDKTYAADRCKALSQAVQQGKTCLNALARSGYPGQPLRRKQLPGVLSVGYWDAVGIQDWGLPLHRNEGIELTVLERGSLIFQVDKRKFTLKPQDLTITRPWQPHSLGNPHIGPGRLHWLILDVGVRRPHQRWIWPDWLVLTQDDLKKLTILLSQNENPVWRVGPDILHAFQQIAQTLETEKSLNSISRLAVLINQLFLSLLDMLRRRRISLKPDLTTTQRTVELYLDNLRKNLSYLAQPWTTNQMARHCGLGVTHFNNLCKKITNMTPARYLNYYRIEAAAELLSRATNKSITDIAFSCGFNSSQYFATLFRQIKGCSPREYQKSNTPYTLNYEREI
jgi:AraC-like DNA-binding protein